MQRLSAFTDDRSQRIIYHEALDTNPMLSPSDGLARVLKQPGRLMRRMMSIDKVKNFIRQMFREVLKPRESKIGGLSHTHCGTMEK
jgi:hypothetical protein